MYRCRMTTLHMPQGVKAQAAPTRWTLRFSLALVLVLALAMTDATASNAQAAVAVDVSAPAGVPYGEAATVSFTTSAPDGETVAVQYLSSGQWKTSSIRTAVSSGGGSLSWTPNSTRTYRLTVGNEQSADFTISIFASLSVTAPTTITYGNVLTASFTTDLPTGSRVAVYYQSGSSWVKSSVSATVASGKGTLSWRPSESRTYRLGNAAATSRSFTTKVEALLSASAPLSVTPGQSVTVTVTTTPSTTGTLALYYRSDTSAWKRSSILISVKDGTGKASWTPSSSRHYSVAAHWAKSKQFTVSVRSINSAITQAALTQVGYEEPSWRDNKFNTWVGDNNAWCSVFVSWSASKAGYAKNVPQESNYDDFVAALEAKGVLRSDNTLPGPGAVVLFDWGSSYGPSHSAIVVSRSGNTLYTVEGNTTDGTGDPQRGVYRRARYMSSVWKWFYPSDL